MMTLWEAWWSSKDVTRMPEYHLSMTSNEEKIRMKLDNVKNPCVK
jgi:hypothetical protein